jgi:type IV pilus assembly protein PilA
MFCPKCGAALQENSQFCSRCGAPATAHPDPAYAQGATSTEAGTTSGKALGSLITGIFGLVLFPAAIVAIVLGHISRSEIRKSSGRLHGAGMALTGLVFGYVGVAFIPILIIAAIAIPNLLRARIAANEASAIGALHDLNVAEIRYTSTYIKVGSAPVLPALGGTKCSPPDEGSACLIDAQLASGQKNGYRFELRNRIHSQTGMERDKYQIVAYPLVRNQSGVRAFCSDETAVIKVDANGSPDECLTDGVPLQ